MLGSSQAHGSPAEPNERACGLLVDKSGVMSYGLCIFRLFLGMRHEEHRNR